VVNYNKNLLQMCFVTLLGATSCAHQSNVEPSTGHIDAKKSVYEKPLSNPLNPGDYAANLAAAENAGNIPKPISNNVYLPPPTPKPKEQVYSIVVYDTPVKEVLFAIARDSQLNVDIHPSIQGNVTLNAVDQTLPAILERLSKQVDLTYYRE
jgi:MSHA biogenesis protein MshL